MEVVAPVAGMRQRAREARAAGRTIGLVPTMGALHAGHLALAARARSECDVVVLSIFVNPLQFGPTEDLASYPRSPEKDAALCREAGVDLLWTPAADDIHPPGHRTVVEVPGMQEVLCGRSRPGHFAGVTTVVAKLLAVVRPDAAYFGEKDAQQVRIIRRMVRDLHDEVRIVACPTVREPDGLALSSRNIYLTPEERRAAPVLCRALRIAAEAGRAGDTDAARVVARLRATIAAEPLAALEYAEAVDGDTLEPVMTLRPGVLIAVAARFGRARLIDNITV
jgi:pantoate--beta-alanine ligase